MDHPKTGRRWMLLATVPLLLGPVAAYATGTDQAGQAGTQVQAAPEAQAAAENSPATASAATPAEPAAADPYDGNLLGGLFGLRPALAKAGVTLNLNEVSEVLGNVSGGIHRNADYEGLTTGSVQVDLDTAFGLKGGTFDASALQVHGRNFSADTLLNLQTESGIEANRATRLWELWYDQKFGDDLDVKVGQQTIDAEFLVSTSSLLFVNTMMGWPLVPSYDLPGGGPAYPLSSPGVRVQDKVTPDVTVLAGVFNGTPLARDGRNGSGTVFPLYGGPLIIGEVQYSIPAQGQLVTPDHPGPLAGTYKLGFWVDTERFDDQRYDETGVSLASPLSDGVPYRHRRNWSVYGVMDQAIWQPAGGGAQVLNAFLRVMGAPADRNLVSLSANGGLVLKAPLAGRDDDSAGIGFGYGQVSQFVRGLDRDVQQHDGGFARSSETFVEATYQYQVRKWWQLQPDFQFTFNPGGGIANPLTPSQKIHNEAVFGLRTNVTF